MLAVEAVIISAHSAAEARPRRRKTSGSVETRSMQNSWRCPEVRVRYALSECPIFNVAIEDGGPRMGSVSSFDAAIGLCSTSAAGYPDVELDILEEYMLKWGLCCDILCKRFFFDSADFSHLGLPVMSTTAVV